MFAENNRELIGKVIRDGRSLKLEVPETEDFLIFLENVVKADAEIEDTIETGKTAKRSKEAFFREKYGGKKDEPQVATFQANKFSLSHVEWLDRL